MFTAVVLVCALQGEEVLSCGPLASKEFYQTYTECKKDVEQDVQAGLLTEIDQVNKIVYMPVRYRCIDWNALEV